MRSNSCPKCTSSMTQGFVLDRDSYGGHRVRKWVEGAPLKGFFGLKIGKRQQLEVQTWRCTRCGYLESYAKN